MLSITHDGNLIFILEENKLENLKKDSIIIPQVSKFMSTLCWINVGSVIKVYQIGFLSIVHAPIFFHQAMVYLCSVAMKKLMNCNNFLEDQNHAGTV